MHWRGVPLQYTIELRRWASEFLGTVAVLAGFLVQSINHGCFAELGCVLQRELHLHFACIGLDRV